MKSFITIFSNIVLAIAIVSILFSIVFFNCGITFITFPFIICEFILYYRYTGSATVSVNRQKKISLVFFIIGITAFVIGFITHSITGGGPYANETGYYIVSHGEILKEITYVTYRLLQLCDTAFFGGLILAFSALFCNAVS